MITLTEVTLFPPADGPPKLRKAQVSAQERLLSHLFPIEQHRYLISAATLALLEQEQLRFRVERHHDGDALSQRIIYPKESLLHAPPDQGAIEEVCAKLMAASVAGTPPYAVYLGRNPQCEAGAFFLDRVGGKRHYQWKLVVGKPTEFDIAASFPHLLKAMRDPDTKLVVSFGAGGLRLFAHPAMMKFLNLLKAREAIAEIWGCSGGASAGLAYAMGVAPETIENEGYDIYNQRYKISFSPSFFSVAKNVIMDALFPSSPDLLRGFASCQHALQTALSRLTAGKELDIPFFCVAYNVKRETNQILTPLAVDPAIYNDSVITVDPIDAIVASSSIPILYVPKVIRHFDGGEEHYIDGAVAEELPLLSVYRKWQTDKQHGLERRKKLLILAVELFPKTVPRWIDSSIARRLPFVDLLRYALGIVSYMRGARLHDQLEPLRKDHDVTVWRIACPLKSRALLDIRAIPPIISSAQAAFWGELEKLEASLAEQSRNSELP